MFEVEKISGNQKVAFKNFVYAAIIAAITMVAAVCTKNTDTTIYLMFANAFACANAGIKCANLEKANWKIKEYFLKQEREK